MIDQETQQINNMKPAGRFATQTSQSTMVLYNHVKQRREVETSNVGFLTTVSDMEASGAKLAGVRKKRHVASRRARSRALSPDVSTFSRMSGVSDSCVRLPTDK